MQGGYKTTFVTAFVSIYDTSHIETNPEKTLERRISHFEDMAKTGIRLCLYVCPVMRPHVLAVVEKYSNVKLMDYNYRESNTYRLCMDETLVYPQLRDAQKDTREYMALMHCKIEFMKDAITQNPWGNDTFAWIDFSIGYIYRNREDSLNRLVEIAKGACPETVLAIPGCWGEILEDSAVLENIHWRFCGGFFIGHKKMIDIFHAMYRIYLPVFLRKHKRALWEVNFWAWLEFNSSWKPVWYYSDHNDSMIHVPSNVLL